ncbi:hypothetical protein MUN86_30615 (plasmid) [Hymenobacter volaticus]|uniref:Uncharacterized protein n=1 Tax=Hymenobacter volaticus TaxID=2932254 RepID=A0ABY4GG40_9BACT|nr:hypothetical protein [Hymenobacter volaticus]UOQ69943.1 hypothetical protein MUN86_30615 [Hymenobacter volaticus]
MQPLPQRHNAGGRSRVQLFQQALGLLPRAEQADVGGGGVQQGLQGGQVVGVVVAEQHVVGQRVGHGGFQFAHRHDAHRGGLGKAGGRSQVGPAIHHGNVPAQRSAEVHQRLRVVAGPVHYQAQGGHQHFQQRPHRASRGV